MNMSHLKNNTGYTAKKRQVNKCDLCKFYKNAAVLFIVVLLISFILVVTLVKAETAETYSVESLSDIEDAIKYVVNHPTIQVDIHILADTVIQFPKKYSLTIPVNVWFYVDESAELNISGGNIAIYNDCVIFINGVINHSRNVYNSSGGKIFLGKNCKIEGNKDVVASGESAFSLNDYWLVTFNANRGSFNGERLKWVVEVRNDLKQVIPEEKMVLVPNREGFSFIFWSEEPSGGKEWDFTQSIIEDVELYAIWTDNTVEAYTVIYDPGEHGIWNVAEETYTNLKYNDPTPVFGEQSGATISDCDNGWTFNGWDKIWIDKVSQSVTYTAQWSGKSSVEGFSVRYFGNGASSGEVPWDNKGYVSGEIATVMANSGGLVRLGYTFLGWAYSSTVSIPDFAVGDSTVSSYSFVINNDDVSLYAVWQAINYTISYQPGTHGTFTTHITNNLHYGDLTPKAPTITSESGWNFTGWQPTPTATVTGNITYIAQWTQTTNTTTPPPSTTSITPTLMPHQTVTPTIQVTPTAPTDSSNDKSSSRLQTVLILGTVEIVLATSIVAVKQMLSKKKTGTNNTQKNENTKEGKQRWFTELTITGHKIISKTTFYFGKIMQIFTSNSLFLALNFVLVIYFSASLYEINVPIVILLLSALTTIAIYSLNKVTDKEEDKINKPNQNTKLQPYFIATAIICYLIVFIVGIIEGTRVFLVLLTPLIIGAIYSIKISKKLPRLKEILGVKNIAVAFSWAFTGAILPAIINTVATKEIILIFLYIFTQLFINTMLFDTLDMPGDKAANIKTMPLHLGEKKNMYFLIIINSLLLLWTGFCFISNTFTKYLHITTFGILYTYGTIWYFTKNKNKNKRLLTEILVDGQWIPIITLILLTIH
jgi:uncharacterized repeat protein (TIGR02543 family)